MNTQAEIKALLELKDKLVAYGLPIESFELLLAELVARGIQP